jgi:hypothetical protein
MYGMVCEMMNCFSFVWLLYFVEECYILHTHCSTEVWCYVLIVAVVFLEKKLDVEGCVQEKEEGSCKTDNLSGDAVISLAATAGEMRKSCRPGA